MTLHIHLKILRNIWRLISVQSNRRQGGKILIITEAEACYERLSSGCNSHYKHEHTVFTAMFTRPANTKKDVKIRGSWLGKRGSSGVRQDNRG